MLPLSRHHFSPLNGRFVRCMRQLPRTPLGLQRCLQARGQSSRGDWHIPHSVSVARYVQKSRWVSNPLAECSPYIIWTQIPALFTNREGACASDLTAGQRFAEKRYDADGFSRAESDEY